MEGKANELIDKITDFISSDKYEVDGLVGMLKDLRPLAIEEEDPMVTRIIRQMFEHLEEHQSFQVTAMTEEDEEGELFLLEPGEDKENLLYVMELIKKSQNEVNREELRMMGKALKEF